MDISTMNVEAVDKLIRTVFGYYNCKINIVNPAELNIDYMLYRSINCLGDHKLPNIVIIHAGCLWFNSTTVNEFLSNTIYTIVHELYHVDQRIEYFRFNGRGGDAEYRQYIEDSNDFMTVCYMLNHQKEIHDLFNVEFDERELNFYKSIYESLISAPPYRRITYEDYIIQVIEGLFCMQDEVQDRIYNVLRMENSVMFITINGCNLLVKNYRYRASVDMINNFFYTYMYQYDIMSIHARENMADYDYCTTYVLDIDIDGKYNMCEIVK